MKLWRGDLPGGTSRACRVKTARRRFAVAAPLALLLAACAAAPKSAREPAPESPANATATSPEAQAQPYPGAQPAQPGYPAAPPPPMPTVSPAAPQIQAGSDFDRAARELDVAAGDCHNACRALSSMDRAAGQICRLSSGSDADNERCSHAKDRVYSARDKVKNSCGQCSETSVDRSAPVPSRP